MLIDWFTVGAQIVNFLILMVLLKIFLYDRIIRAMDDREQQISARLEEADRTRREADRRRQEIEAEKQSLEENRETWLNDAREAARAKRNELERGARSDVDALKNRWTKALDDQKKTLAGDIQRRAVQEALAMTRRVVAAMADEDFRNRLLDTFAGRLRALDRDEKEVLVQSLDRNDPSATVLSDGALDDAQRGRITHLLQEEFHPDLRIDYRTDGDLLGGIELRLPGRKVSWSPRQYLEDMEENILQAMRAAAVQPEERPGKGPHEEEGGAA